ncbi:MAG: DUF2127 domain-containing protein [Xanthomonadales bacterium]|jgi:uncharacterized membrane protein (DUF2068 family)|nr:DUF2127 domain-containing protein [Xanthomonadales bacterium]
MQQDAPYDPSPRAHPGLHVIAIIESFKGALALLTASGLEVLGPAPIRAFIHRLIELFQLDAQHSALSVFMRKVNPESVHWAAAVVAAYGLLHLLESWGLWRAKAWASWLGCITAAIYLPFEFYALITRPGWIALVVVAINLAIVWVLARDVLKRHRAEKFATLPSH